MEELKARKEKGCDSRDIGLPLAFMDELQKRANRQLDVVREAAALFEKKRKDLLEAGKKRKMMEIHKGYPLREYKADLALSERRETDDLPILRFARR